MRPEEVGLDTNALVLGKHSGRHALKQRLQEMGFDPGQEDFEAIFIEFKRLADTQKEVVEADLNKILDRISKATVVH